MANRSHEVTFSTGLLEKLAGLRKPEASKPALPRPAIQLPTRSPISPTAARLLAEDKQLTRQLQATKEVAGLLVKHEEAEVKKIQEKAEELLKKYTFTAKPPPCQSEAQACTQCFNEHGAEAWRCAGVADAYNQCAVKEFNSRIGGGASLAAARG